MTRLARNLASLCDDCSGSMAIDTVLCMPFLLGLSIGSYEVSRMVSRQSELQSAAAEVSSVALATEPTSPTRRDTVKAIIQTSTGLNQDQVSIEAAYRCGNATVYVVNADSCGSNRVSSFVKVVLTDTYSPIWTQFGVGSSVSYRITRYVMIKQQALAT